AIRDEPLAGYAAYTGPVNPFSERERMAAERQAEVERRRAAADTATAPEPGRKDLSVQADQDRVGVSAGHTERQDFAPAEKDLSAAMQDVSGIGSKYLEGSTQEDSLRSSPAREQDVAAEAERTDGSGSTKKENRKIRGIDPAASVAVGGEHVAIIDE